MVVTFFLERAVALILCRVIRFTSYQDYIMISFFGTHGFHILRQFWLFLYFWKCILRRVVVEFFPLIHFFISYSFLKIDIIFKCFLSFRKTLKTEINLWKNCIRLEYREHTCLILLKVDSRRLLVFSPKFKFRSLKFS